MKETRCNFCGDTINGEPNQIEVPFGRDKKFVIELDVTEVSKSEQYCDNHDDMPRFLNIFGSPVRYINDGDKEDDVDICFGCSCSLVAVAYDNYVKKGARRKRTTRSK